ncbi:transcriptional regulator Spx [Weissella diestrammenae]|uniref:Transcriptional regulator Spx n=1 Tax=Weissella diestrammenae TaxID=1162633 RepID=A0A7G9T4S6_9LACO|nr:transcriptional regulator Spx [Weissella diestrammenae]MCM0582813.1 transcriptional regulator Spx [Weissella diestrammenae]QNN75101.1 transcriptional regulator Spx [Weissella diestrammenae]
MVTLFTSPSCTSCRKAKAWLEMHDIPYIERNMMKHPMSREEIKHILSLTEGGTEEIISVRSKLFSDMKTRLDDLTLNEMIDLIQQYPALIKRPLLVDDKCLQVGYNEDEIRCFLPRKVRQAELARLTLLA